MRSPKLWYHVQKYQSHARVGAVYESLLRSHFQFAHTPKNADIIILHIEPHDYASLYEAAPYLRSKYVISYAVWEATPLPDAYKKSLALVQEVWTASQYCVNVIRASHPNVYLIPHVVERNRRADALDGEIVRRLMLFDPSAYYFLSIVRTLGFRKNVKGLVNAFLNVAEECPHARLIVKGLPGDPRLECSDSRVIYIPVTLSDAQINALYENIDAYVSAHHSEGWGLALSDAMLLEKPVVATGYSGNMDFMSQENSYPIAFSETPIARNEIFGRFTTEMKWAEPDLDHLADTMKALCSGDLRPQVDRKVAAAVTTCAGFSRAAISSLLIDRIEQIAVGI